MRRVIAATAVLNAFGSLVPQVIGIVFLSSTEFGRFSVLYLLYSFAMSVLMSILCDTWVVTDSTNGSNGWPLYGSVLSGCAVIAGLSGGAIGLLVLEGARTAVIAAVCLAVATYRIGARYYLAHSGRWYSVTLSDVSLFFVTVSVFIVMRAYLTGFDALLVAWAGGNFIACTIAGRPWFKFNSARRWVCDRRRTIAPLLADTLTMNLASIGTPFILLPILGMQGFGIYRAVSNLAAPVRIAVAPLRPLIIRSPKRLVAPKFRIAVSAFGLGVGGAVSAGLLAVRYFDIKVGVLFELSIFAIPTGIYVFSALLVSVYSLVVRAGKNARVLLLGRGAYTVLGLLCPLLGYVLGGLEGAIWGFAVGSLVSGFTWSGAAFVQFRGRK